MGPNPVLEGFFLGISLIAAIGAQNLFVLRQAIIGRHVFLTAATSSMCDFLLIILGTLGAGSIIAEIAWLRMSATLAGVLFLSYYALKSFRNVLQGTSVELLATPNGTTSHARNVFVGALTFSLLNPHAILDTVVLIGGLSGQYLNLSERLLFALGAGTASFVWFFSLAYGANVMNHLFRKRSFAIGLDIFVGCIMLWIAYGLLTEAIKI
jgi:L-lysine exporter family protein LysE/ArgO